MGRDRWVGCLFQWWLSGFGCEVLDGDGRAGECVDCVAVDFGAGREFLEFVVVSGVDAFDDPSGFSL